MILVTNYYDIKSIYGNSSAHVSAKGGENEFLELIVVNAKDASHTHVFSCIYGRGNEKKVQMWIS